VEDVRELRHYEKTHSYQIIAKTDLTVNISMMVLYGATSGNPGTSSG
jgi:hypothetical protein